MLRGEFYFTFCESKIFHNPKDYFISHSDISLHTTLRIDLLPLLCLYIKGGDEMKKKIIIGVFSLLILITAIIFVVSAIWSYNYDVTNNSDDKWLGFGAVLTLMVGGIFVFYELDLFYTVYYFLIKPKTVAKSILNILANLILVIMYFTDTISHFLFKYVSEIFGEEIILLFTLFFTYIILRIVSIAIPVRQYSKEKQE